MVLTFDLMVLIDFFMHLLIPVTNFYKFGWAFCFVYFGIPFIAPFMAFYGALRGSVPALKALGNVNSCIILYNIPLTIFLTWINHDHDTPYNILVLVFMVAIKIGMSGVSAKVC